jgi:hypothetical protein
MTSAHGLPLSIRRCCPDIFAFARTFVSIRAPNCRYFRQKYQQTPQLPMNACFRASIADQRPSGPAGFGAQLNGDGGRSYASAVRRSSTREPLSGLPWPQNPRTAPGDLPQIANGHTSALSWHRFEPAAHGPLPPVPIAEDGALAAPFARLRHMTPSPKPSLLFRVPKSKSKLGRNSFTGFCIFPKRRFRPVRLLHLLRVMLLQSHYAVKSHCLRNGVDTHPRHATLGSEAMMHEALRRANRRAFSDPSFIEPLKRLLKSYEEEADLSGFGRHAVRFDMMRC